MKTKDIKNIRYLVASFGVIYFIISILGSFVLFAYEPNLGNQFNAIGVAIITSLTIGLNNFELNNIESKNLTVVFQILGSIAWAHFCPIIAIFWKSKADDLPDASGGFVPKNE